MKAVYRMLLCLGILALSALSQAETLTGSATNGTSNKPAAGDEVVLIKLGQGMEEAARSKTNAAGKFSFNLDDPGPHLIRVIHQGVTYHRPVPPGTSSVQVKVYDVAQKLADISVAADLMYVQARSGELGVTRVFSVNNSSQPPRTQMNDHNFEFYLPDGAQIDGGDAQTAGGQAVNSAPVPQAEKGRYAFVFPLRPGETQFQVTYRLPYSGSIQLDPKSLYPLQHFVVMLPRSMHFAAAQKGAYVERQPPNQPNAVAEVAANARPGQVLSFTMSGVGLLQEEAGENEAPAAAAGGESRPGGGLGPPIDAPDPLEKYRWYILGGFAVVLAAGAVYIAKRPQTAAAGESYAREAAEVTAPSSAPAHSARLMDALKEELFQLEVEHKQGGISQAEYEKAKAALDQTLERAIRRGGPKR